MSTSTRIKRLFGGLGAVLLVLVLGYLAIRPLHLRWGATDAEVARALPGDPQKIGAVWTRAITVDATPAQIWPWLAQWGQGRGGWYSYDWLENLFGMQIHTADRILPEHQSPAVGDQVCLAPGACFAIFIVEPGRFFGWQATFPDGSIAWTFLLGLDPVDATHTRLFIRESIGQDAMSPIGMAGIEVADVVMELKALHTLKGRAEGVRELPLLAGLEILLWLAALIPGVAAGALMLTRRDWRAPLALGLASVVVLLGLTFLFPHLWLRAALGAGLWLGLLMQKAKGKRQKANAKAGLAW